MDFVFGDAPQRIYWEVTRACGLACRHCRAEAMPFRSPWELTTVEAKRLLDQIAEFGSPPPHVIFTGGDPLERPDLYELCGHAVALGIPISLSPSATPRLTRESIRKAKEVGVEAMSLSLDGSTAERHDAIRGIAGTFERTLDCARDIIDSGILLQVNTLVAAETIDDIPAIGDLVASFGAQRWSLFFLVTVGRGKVLSQITPEQCETMLGWVLDRARASAGKGPIVTTTEAPFYRRLALQRMHGNGRPAAAGGERGGHAQQARRGYGIRDGNGIMFIAHNGDVCPSGFLPVVVDNVRRTRPTDIYRDAPLFRALRDPSSFEGRCGRCEYRAICGGARARAYGATGSALGTDPLCSYEPARGAQELAETHRVGA